MSQHPYFDPNRLLPPAPVQQRPRLQEVVIGWLHHVQHFLFSLNGIGLLVATLVFIVFVIWLSIRLVHCFMNHLDGVLK